MANNTQPTAQQRWKSLRGSLTLLLKLEAVAPSSLSAKHFLQQVRNCDLGNASSTTSLPASSTTFGTESPSAAPTSAWQPETAPPVQHALLEIFFFAGPFCKHPGAVLMQQTTGGNQTHDQTRTEASSPHAGGEQRCLGEVSEDITQKRSLAIKVRGVGEGK